MCCKRCLQSSSCHTLTHFHLHPAEHSFLPAPHYHLCGPTHRVCDLNCKVCGKLIREMPHLPSSHFIFGCCHRCAEYLQCDFADRHRKSLREPELAESVSKPAALAATPRAENAKSSVPKQAPDRLRVLLLDDNAEFRESAVEYLALDPGLQVFGAADGYTALHIMHEFRPTVVVCDLVMDGMNGFDFCRNLRKEAHREDVHVLALTAFASRDMVEKALACGAEQCLSKPIQLQKLKDVMWAAARGKAVTPAQGEPAAPRDEKAQNAAELPGERPSEPKPAPGGSAPPAEASDPSAIRVLVVDNDAAFLEAMIEFLQDSPEFIVRGARNGFTALRQFFSFKPHVVVLDLLMPEISGFDVCHAIRRSEFSAKTRILAVTGDPSPNTDLRAKTSGADGCLKKPVKLDHLKQETRRLGQEVLGHEASQREAM